MAKKWRKQQFQFAHTIGGQQQTGRCKSRQATLRQQRIEPVLSPSRRYGPCAGPATGSARRSLFPVRRSPQSAQPDIGTGIATHCAPAASPASRERLHDPDSTRRHSRNRSAIRAPRTRRPLAFAQALRSRRPRRSGPARCARTGNPRAAAIASDDGSVGVSTREARWRVIAARARMHAQASANSEWHVVQFALNVNARRVDRKKLRATGP